MIYILCYCILCMCVCVKTFSSALLAADRIDDDDELALVYLALGRLPISTVQPRLILLINDQIHPPSFHYQGYVSLVFSTLGA